MCKNTTRSIKREVKTDSEFWRTVIEQACINQALSVMINEIENLRQTLRVQLWDRQKGFIRVLGDKINFPKPTVRDGRIEVRFETFEKM